MPQKDKVSCSDAAKSPTALARGKRNAVQPQPSENGSATPSRKGLRPRTKTGPRPRAERVRDPLRSNTIKLSGNLFYYKYFLYFCPVERCLLFRQMLKVRRTTLTD